MGCGTSKLRTKLESEITEKRELKIKLQATQLENALKRNELTTEIKRAVKDVNATKKEFELAKRRSESEFEQATQKWTEENTELSLNLEKTTEVATVAMSDAQRMRILAMQMDDVSEENRRLVREKYGIQSELEKAKEELKLARLVFEGQKQVLEIEKEQEAEKGTKAIEEASERFQQIERTLVCSVREVEERLTLAEDRERIQREANVALLRQGVPHGSVAVM
eukprot:m.53721 g.53721  ORF g.53721 m.53721 type:complete len:224 (+) comp21807_c0_seq2:350-1021(+)